RRRLERVTFIPVTGSWGKTTTKHLIASILASELRGKVSPGATNRLTIVGKTVLRTSGADDFALVEVAAWTPGSVARAARVVRPDIAVVTSVGSDHRTAFRTLDATPAEKR